LRLYQSAFEVVARKSGYKLQKVVETVYATFQQRVVKDGTGFLELVLQDAVSGSLQEQDSPVFPTRAGNKAGIAALFDRAEGDE